MEVLGMHLPYVKRFFQPHERDRSSHFNDTFSKMFSAMEILGMFLRHLKGILSRTSDIFFFRAQTTQILLILGMPVWERSNVTI